MVAELSTTRLPEFCTQSGFAYRIDWGLEGLEALVAARPRLHDALTGCASGRELRARGWEDDVATSAAHDVSTTACLLIGNEFHSR